MLPGTEKPVGAGNLVSAYVNFCRNTGLNGRDAANLPKVVLANLRSLNRRRAYKAIHAGDPYLDWGFVEAMTENTWGGAAENIAVVGFLVFPDIESQYKVTVAH